MSFAGFRRRTGTETSLKVHRFLFAGLRGAHTLMPLCLRQTDQRAHHRTVAIWRQIYTNVKGQLSIRHIIGPAPGSH